MKFYVPFDIHVYNNFIHDNSKYDLQFNYNLTNESIVIDAGGYEGEFTSNIYSKFNCTVHVFEPVRSMYELLKMKFDSNPKIFINQLGLSNSDHETTIYLNQDGSSIYGNGPSEIISCIDIVAYLHDHDISTIDLIKLNIEGDEYDVIERLIEKKLISYVKNLQVQFHRFIPDCNIRRDKIHKHLSKTHTLQWNYDWIWESWSLNE